MVWGQSQWIPSGRFQLSHSECEDLFEASKALLEKSGLARWDDQAFVFVPMHPGGDDFQFEKHWKKRLPLKVRQIHGVGNFSVGGENLAKAACVCKASPCRNWARACGYGSRASPLSAMHSAHENSDSEPRSCESVSLGRKCGLKLTEASTNVRVGVRNVETVHIGFVSYRRGQALPNGRCHCGVTTQFCNSLHQSVSQPQGAG